MSSSPPPSTTTSAAVSASASTYWCHECDMSILLSPPPPPLPPRCPHCQNSFLQHMDSFPPSIWASSNSSPIFPSLSDLSASNSAAVAPPGDNFLLNRPYLHRLIHHLTTSASGLGGGQSAGGGGGDFYEPPPINPGSVRASRATIESLKMIRIGGDLVEFCSICKDQFGDESMGNELPCGHIFHNGCIVPWLEINNTCPLCRFRLESEEEEEEEELGGDWLERSEEAYIGAMRLDELLDDGDGGDEGDYENEFRQLMRIERGGVWNNEGESEGGRMMFSPTQIGEAGTGGVVDRANSVETVSSWPVWQAEGEREVGTSDVENVVRA